MAFRRRNVLGLIGAAAAAPLMPMGASAAGYSRGAYAAAVAHAQKYPMVSIRGMVKWLGVSAPQAEAIMGEMNRSGLVEIMTTPSTRSGMHASSKILTGDHWGLIRTAEPRPVQAVQREQPQTPDAPIDTMMTYLHDLCRAQGMTLNHRCFA